MPPDIPSKIDFLVDKEPRNSNNSLIQHLLRILISDLNDTRKLFLCQIKTPTKSGKFCKCYSARSSKSVLLFLDRPSDVSLSETGLSGPLPTITNLLRSKAYLVTKYSATAC